MSPAAGENAIRHGVLLHWPQSDNESFLQIFSLEEAREMENRRGFQEAASPDWVG
jgi:hypothetical protein